LKVKNTSLENIVPEGSLYPFLTVAGIGKWLNNELIFHTSSSEGEHRLNASAAVLLHYCDGNYKINELIEIIGREYTECTDALFANELHQGLGELADRKLIRFSCFKPESVPVVSVQFQGFWPGFDPEYNYFSEMMAREMFVIITDTGNPDILFQSDYESRPDLPNSANNDYLRVFVSSGKTIPDLKSCNYAFSPCEVGQEYAHRHTRIPHSRYAHTGHFKPHHRVAEEFFNFLFPVNPEKLRFSFPQTDKKPALTSLDTDPWLEPQDLTDNHENSSEIFHVLFSTDFQHREGLFALINSILENTHSPGNFYFHILVDDNSDYYEHVLKCRFNGPFRYEVVSFKDTRQYERNIDFLIDYIYVKGGARETGRIDNLMNFARFYLPEIFPDVDVGLYLDVDMIVQTDLMRLLSVNLFSNIVASPLNRTFWNYHSSLEMTGKGFNTGFLLTDFHRWRENNVSQAIENVMNMHRSRNLFGGGTQPVLNVVFYNQCTHLQCLWNVGGLGCRKHLDTEHLEQAWILHWSGGCKPWLENGLYKEFWEKYRIALPALDYAVVT